MGTLNLHLSERASFARKSDYSTATDLHPGSEFSRLGELFTPGRPVGVHQSVCFKIFICFP